MAQLDIWIELKVGLHNYAGAHDLVAAKEVGNVRLETHFPVSKINYPAIRSELHAQLDAALDRIQAKHPPGVPYVK